MVTNEEQRARIEALTKEFLAQKHEFHQTILKFPIVRDRVSRLDAYRAPGKSLLQAWLEAAHIEGLSPQAQGSVLGAFELRYNMDLAYLEAIEGKKRDKCNGPQTRTIADPLE